MQICSLFIDFFNEIMNYGRKHVMIMKNLYTASAFTRMLIPALPLVPQEEYLQYQETSYDVAAQCISSG